MYGLYGKAPGDKKPEELIIYTKDKKTLGILTKERYKRTKSLTINGENIEPWVECVTCFIIDKNTKDIAIQLRGMHEIDPGEFDLCSGHVAAGEINRLAMIRELKEEMTMAGYDNERIANDLIFCGKIRMDFSKTKHGKGNNTRCFATAYAIEIDDKSHIIPNDSAVVKVGWLNFERLKDEIRKSNFRFPYTDENSNEYETVFDNVEKVIRRKTKSNRWFEFFQR